MSEDARKRDQYIAILSDGETKFYKPKDQGSFKDFIKDFKEVKKEEQTSWIENRAEQIFGTFTLVEKLGEGFAIAELITEATQASDIMPVDIVGDARLQKFLKEPKALKAFKAETSLTVSELKKNLPEGYELKELSDVVLIIKDDEYFYVNVKKANVQEDLDRSRVSKLLEQHNYEKEEIAKLSLCSLKQVLEIEKNLKTSNYGKIDEVLHRKPTPPDEEDTALYEFVMKISKGGN